MRRNNSPCRAACPETMEPHKDSRKNLTHPEHDTLSKIEWDFFITIHPLAENSALFFKSERGEKEREKLLRDFFRFLRAGLKLREKDLFWVGTSEECGKGGIPHVHALLELRSERAKQCRENVEDAAQHCFREMSTNSRPLDCRLDPVKPTEESFDRVASYLAKRDGGREEKSFWFSTWFDAKFKSFSQ
jgi:hypothetical protein